MIWYCRVPIRIRVEPDFVAAGCLSIESKPTKPEPSRDLAIAKSGKPAHSTRDHNDEIATFAYRR